MKKYLQIFIIFVFAFFLSHLLIKNIFLANTPKINPYFVSNITGKIKNRYIAFFDLIRSKSASDEESNQEVIFESISKGVSAAQTNEGTIIKVTSEHIDWIEYTFNVNGKEIKIKVPKDQSPPDQQTVEDLYQ